MQGVMGIDFKMVVDLGRKEIRSGQEIDPGAAVSVLCLDYIAGSCSLPLFNVLYTFVH